MRLRRGLVALAAAVAGAVSAGACSSSGSSTATTLPTASSVPGPAGLVAYVANTYDQGAGFIEPVCLATGQIGARIPVGGQPFVIVVAPDGEHAYVANSGWDGPRSQSTVTPIDLATGTAGPAIPAGLGPMGIAITPDGSRAYVADMGSFLYNQMSTMIAADTLTPIDLTTNTALAPIRVGPGVGAVEITPDGSKAVIAVDGTQTHPQSYVVVMDLATGSLSAPITTGSAPMAIAVTPDSRTAFVTDTGFRPIGHTVTPVDLVTGKPMPSIPVGQAPIDIVMTPDGRTAYVANAVAANDNSFAPTGIVSTVSVASRTAVGSITVPGVPQALSITPDGKTVYEVGMEGNEQSALAAIDVATNKVVQTVQIPLNLGAVAVAKAPHGFCGG